MDENSLESWLLNYVNENFPTFIKFQRYQKGLSRLKFILELEDEKIIFRIFSDHDQKYFLNERKALEALSNLRSKHLDFSEILNILDINGVNVLIMRFIEGEALDIQLAAGIEVWKAWNILEVPKLEISTHNKITRDWMKGLQEGINKNHELFDNTNNIKNQYLAIIDKFLNHWPQESDLRLIHGDFHLENIIKNNHQYGIIDWEYCSIGDPIFDLAYLIIYFYGEKIEHEGITVFEDLSENFESITEQLKIDYNLFMEWGTLASLIISLWFLEKYNDTQDKICKKHSIKYLQIAEFMDTS